MSNFSEQLHLALKSGELSMVEPLLRAGADPNLPDASGTTPLHIICDHYRDDDDSALTLFELSDDKYLPLRVDSKDQWGRTPLHEALYRGHEKLVALLLRQGADVTIAAQDGTTALHIVAKLSRDVDDDPNVDRFIDMFIGNLPPSRFRRSMRVDGTDDFGNTPLHYALENLHLQLSVWLLSRGADFNAANKRGTTPLHVMCDRLLDDSDDFLDEFFQCTRGKRRRVLIDALDLEGRTPLQLAVANLLPKTVQILLSRGADLSSFVFPDRSYFALKIDPADEFFLDNKGELAARALTVVELLDEFGYQLDSKAQLTFMGFFAEHRLFENPENVEELWYKDEEFAEEAKEIMMTENDSSPSLYDLILMGPKEAKKALTYWDFYEWAQNSYSVSEEYNWICVLHLCEKMSRGLFLQWAVVSFRKLIHYRLPEEMCDFILEDLPNKDLYNICLAAPL